MQFIGHCLFFACARTHTRVCEKSNVWIVCVQVVSDQQMMRRLNKTLVSGYFSIRKVGEYRYQGTSEGAAVVSSV